MKIALTLAALLLVASSSTYAATQSTDLFANTSAQTDGLVLLNSSYVAKIGRYTGGALTASSTFADINASWNQIGQIAFATGAAAGFDGYFNTSAITFNDAQGFGGANIWVFITDGDKNNALITGLGTFKFDASVPNTQATSITATNAASLTYALGSYNAGAASPFGGGAIILNNAIPEPSTFLLTSMGVLVLLRRRR